jgi:hypothetical protein
MKKNKMKLMINGEFLWVDEADAPAIIDAEIKRLERCRKLDNWMQNRRHYVKLIRQSRRNR